MFPGTRFILVFFCSSALVACNSHPKVERIDQKKEQIALGKRLFFDKRLSVDNTISCASCHLPDQAFTNGKAFGVGVKDQLTGRNVPTIINSKFLKSVMFDGAIVNLERQILVPLTEHNEMGSNIRDLMLELEKDPSYQKAAQRAYGRKFDPYVLTRSIAAYERSLVAMNSRYDQYMNGDKTALTSKELAGMKLFTQQLYCVKCHPAPHFTTFQPENNGLYLNYSDQGRYRVTGKESDKGKFKIPSLRNVALTAPYMHDGSFLTLEKVIAHYATGGKHHVNQSEHIQPFRISDEEKENLVLFLKTLTDTVGTK